MIKFAQAALMCAALSCSLPFLAQSVFAAPKHRPVASADPCSTHLLPRLAFTSGPGIKTWTLRGNGTMHLATAAKGFYAPGMKVPANDRVAEFFFQPSGSKHHYAGPINGFVHGGVTHLCLNERLYMDFDESSKGTKHGMTNVRIDGQIKGGVARLTVWVMGHTYHLSGR